MLNSIDDVNLTGEACSLLNIDDFEKVLDETFDNVVDNTNFDYTGWINYAEVGGELWTEQFYSGNGYVEFSGFRTGDDVNIGWLVTPPFDLSGATNAYINFKLAQHHLDDEVNNTLEVFLSTDFDGSNVAGATWEKINVPVPGEEAPWYAFQDVGLVDVSSYSGSLYVAFKYVGSGNDTSLDGGYFVDDVLFLKQQFLRISFYTILTAFSFYISLHAQIPDGYYNSAENKSDQALRSALHNTIDDHTDYPYSSSSTDTWDILKDADADPNNANNVILIYTRESVNGPQEYDGWNREHVWAKSRGDFGTSRPMGTDVHNLRASNNNVNSTRSNYSFDDCTSNSCEQTYGNSYSSSALVFEPRDEDKGDVARIIFYMVVRYEGDSGEEDLEMTESILSVSSKSPRHGVRSTLLEWHELDPVDDFERNRNDVIYSYQDNRNPFIDHPELVDFLWGDQQQTSWNSSLSNPA